MVYLFFHPGDEAARLRQVFQRTVVQRLDQRLHRCERRAQLVGDVADEVPADSLQPPDLGQVLQHHQEGGRRAGERQRSGDHAQEAPRPALLDDARLLLGSRPGLREAARHFVIARDLGETVVERLGGAHVQDVFRGPVDLYDRIVLVDDQQAVGHVGEDVR